MELQFETEIDGLEPYEGYDLIVAADGANSKVRGALAHVFKPDIDVRRCKYIWLGTHQKFDDAFTFIFEETDKGWIWAHAYQFDARDGDVHRRVLRGDLAQSRLRPHEPGGDARRRASAIFARNLGGHRLMTNARHLRGSAWLNFNRVLCEAWSHENIVLMGDAAATAHFSVGSGTKLALESAIALAEISAHRAHHGGGVQALRGGAAHAGAAAAERGAQLHRVVRGRGALSSISTPCSSTTRC